MKVVRSARLHVREGASDKVYEIDLVENDALAAAERYLVNVRYGRRGAILREGSKTPQPVAQAAAAQVFDSVLVSKLNGGYRRTDRPAQDGAGGAAPAESGGRDGVLLGRLAACRRGTWPDAARDRLLWRIGELRLARAAPDLIALARATAPDFASYALVWALARAAGAAAIPELEAAAREARNPAVRDLARFALASALTGAPQALDAAEPDLPDAVARPAEAGDVDGLCEALAGLAGQDPARVGPTLVALGRRAQGDPRLHRALCAALGRLPARPPYLIGLRRLFKHAEMADDAGLFGSTARRFATATAMYRAGRTRAYLPELGRSIPVRTARGERDARLGLSSATRLYLKRRIWRSLRKRGAAGDPAFAEMAAGVLLSLGPEDLAARLAWTIWSRRPDGAWGHETRGRGPLAQNWTASQLLYRHAPQAMPRARSLTFLEAGEIDPDRRTEAFPELWSARPDLAVRLAAEGRIEPVARLGLRLLRADRGARDALTPADLARLLAAPVPAAQRFAYELARDRLAAGGGDPELLSVLVAAASPEARALALRRIEADPALPWSSGTLALALLTSPAPEVAAALPGLAGRGAWTPGAGADLAGRLVAWLRALPPVLEPATRAELAAMRAGLPVLWPAGDLPVNREAALALIAHPAPEVAAAGLVLLSRSGGDAAALPADLWERLIGSGSESVQEALLGLLVRLDGAALGAQAERILALALGPFPALRTAARPLVRRLTEADPVRADRVARDLIGSLFRAAPDGAYADDIRALLAEATPGALAALDAGTLWRLLQARAKGAQRLGAAVLEGRTPDLFSVRQIARLGDHPYLSVRRWAMRAVEAAPARFQAEAAEAVLLVETSWPEVQAFARDQLGAWPEEAWTLEALAVVTDSVRPEVLAFARDLLRRRLRPEETGAQLLRLLEHPAPAMHLLITELLTERAVASADAFARLIPLARIVMLQVLKGRLAKDRMAAFLRGQALRDRARAELLLPLFADLTLSGTARDRAAAILALRDLADAHPGLETPLVRHAPTARRAAGAAAEATR